MRPEGDINSTWLPEQIADELRRLAGCKVCPELWPVECVAIADQIATLTAERDQLLEDIKERDRTYLAVQKAEGLEREKVELERDALRTALEAADGIFNEMHPHTQGHTAENCTRRTDFCGVAMVVREALGGKS